MRKFLINISYTVLPVWLFFVGMAIYLWVINDNSGDLMRLGLINSGPEYTDSIRSALLPEVYYSSQDDERLLRLDTCGVLVIGDSFSHGGGVGKQGDYVNYLAHESGRKVVVYTPSDPSLSSPMQVAYDVLNLGFVDSSNVKNLVVQEVERYLVGRHCSFTTKHTSIPRIEKKEEQQEPASKPSPSPLLRVKDYLFYHLFGANPILKARLSRPVFGGVQPDMLYFYNEDVKMGYDATDEHRGQVVDCYRQVIEAARQRGVNLILLVAGDKYDMYQNYIVDNPYPAKTLNEDLQQWMAPELDYFVFSKQVLQPYIEQGVKDVYLFNDTHWSPASSHLIAGEIIKKLK
ncbi:MAG: hypothetical protein IKW97_00225 [Muribaculaceae bacterium]|nr:hypothetical protein [Muribaculaceae bacterium]